MRCAVVTGNAADSSYLKLFVMFLKFSESLWNRVCILRFVASTHVNADPGPGSAMLCDQTWFPTSGFELPAFDFELE